MPYYAMLADTATKDIVVSARYTIGPGVGTPNIILPDMSGKVEVFVDESHPLWSGIEAANAAGGIDASYKLNMSNDDVEAR